MRGGMTGLVVDDKENTPVRVDGKQDRLSSGRRRLSISGSKPNAHYLRGIANRFKRKGGAGQGRILVHHPLRFDGSPFEFDSRSDGEKRRSFVVFEDVVDSASRKPKEFATDVETAGKGPASARFKNATLGKCRTLIPGGTGEQAGSIESVQQKSKYYALESIVAFRARAKAMFTVMSRPSPVASLVEAANEEESSARTALENQPGGWQRGVGGRVYSQCSLDTSELEDIGQLFRNMDKEDLEEEFQEQDLDMGMQKCDLTEETQEKEIREHEELLVSAEVIEAQETGKVHVEEQANVRELTPEQLNRQHSSLVSPRVGGLKAEGEIAIVELATPDLRVDQEKPVSPVLLELGVSPEASDADRDIKQQAPVGHKYFGYRNQDIDSPQQSPEDVESQLEQTVNDVLVWSVELDPSRRRREVVADYRNWRTPLLEHLVHSSFRSADQMPRSANDSLRQPAQLNFSMPLSTLNSGQLGLNGPVKNLVEAYEREYLSTSLPSSSGKDPSEQAEGVEIIDGGFVPCPDQANTDEDEMRIALIENEREMRTWRDTRATLRSSWSSWPDQSPVRPIDLSAQCMGCLHEIPSESSLESPSSQVAELRRRVESVTATPLVQASFDAIGTSPTPPRDLCLFLGNPFGQMSGEDLSRRWLQFCTSPSVFSDVIARSKKSWKVESTFTEATSLGPTTSFPSEQLLQRTFEACVQPSTEEEAVSSDPLQWKSSTHDDVLLNAAEEALSSDGSDGVMDFENDVDDISDDTTQIIQTGASSAYNDLEGTSALKECPQEDVPLGEDLHSLSLSTVKDDSPVTTTNDPAVEYSLTNIEEEHIDQFVSALQVTPAVDVSRVERLNINGDDVSKVIYDGNSPPGTDGRPSLIKEQITPGKDANKSVSQPQDECISVRKQSKTKRSRKSTKSKKLDSPLGAGSKWSNGKRQSTRIRSKPLDWWRGERMLYGRVHSSLNTLIGIKHLSPDPVWPRPRAGDRNNKVGPQKFKVDSFVSDEHKELLRLAAQ